MKTLRERVDESTEVSLYKQLLDTLSDYCTKFPATGVDSLLDKIIDKGKSVIPSDKVAKQILTTLLKDDIKSSVVQTLLNIRFASLPTEIKPRYKNKRKIEVAFWTCGEAIGDKAVSLLNINGGRGRWTDEGGNTVTLIGD